MATIEFQRQPHDRENPYTVLSNQILRHEELSFDAAFLLCRMLSLPPGWRLSEESLRKYRRTTPIGRDHLKRMVRELADHGYLQKVAIRDEKGRIVCWRWLVSEFPRSQPDPVQDTENPSSGSEVTSAEKMPSQGGFSQNTGYPAAGQSTPILSTDTHEVLKEKILSLSQPCRGDEEIALSLGKEFLDSLQQRKEDVKLPSIESTVKAMRLMIKRDNRTPEKIRAVIAFLNRDSFWGGVVLSAPKLRKQFDQLELRMQSQAVADNLEANRMYVRQAIAEGYPLIMEGKWVRHRTNSKELSLEMDPEAFHNAFQGLHHVR